MVGVLQAEIDSGGGRATIGSMTNQASLGSAFATGNYTVGSATTKEVNAYTVFPAKEGPALIELDGTAACRINLAADEYS